MPQIRLVPRDERFFVLFEQAADLAVEGVAVLQQLLADTDDVTQYQTTMADIEHRGDKVFHEVQAKLNHSFVTPLDPEDIRAIASRLDDIIDGTQAAVERVALYRVIYTHPGAIELTGVLLQAVQQVQALLPGLRDLRQREEIQRHCIELNRLENSGDQIYRNTLSTLFLKGDMLELLRWKEIVERIEQSINHCESLADIIEFTLLKHS